jgi:hypothetical protein
MPKRDSHSSAASFFAIVIVVLVAGIAPPASVKADGAEQSDPTQQQIDRNQAVQVFNTFRRPREASSEPPCQSIHCTPPDHHYQH